MSANPSALLRLWNEFERVEPDVVLGGIYANKSGYHNTRANHLRDRPSDYSIQDPLDRQGPSDKAAAIDLTFNTARASDFRIIAKYSKRLLTAFRVRDPLLFHDGKPVVREFYGNADLDRDVEGWSLYRNRAGSSDSSHLWHIHISFHRWAVENWAAVAGVLAVLLGATPEPEPAPEDDMPTAKHIVDELLSRQIDLTDGEQERYDYGESISVRSLLVHAGGGARQIMRTLTTPPLPEPPAETTYTVQPGDTLTSIAARFGVDVDDLAEANDIPNPDLIQPGQDLTIPQGGTQ